jgi:hypothetical protein
MKTSARIAAPCLLVAALLFGKAGAFQPPGETSPLSAAALPSPVNACPTLPADAKSQLTSVTWARLQGRESLNQAIIQDIAMLNKNYAVSVPVYFMEVSDKNAFFVADSFPALILADGADPNTRYTGSVFVSTALLDQESKETHGTLLTIPAILAHEFAHAMQCKNSFPYDGVKRELHADFMAGWYTGFRGRMGLPVNMQQAWMSFMNKGDFELNLDPDHHGKPEQRGAAFSEGYKLSTDRNESSAWNAYQAGLQYVEHAYLPIWR